MIVAAVAASAALSQSYNPAVTFEPYQPSGIYAVGQRVGWTLHAPLGLGSQRFHYTIRENNAFDLKSGEVDLSSGQSVIETSVDHPAMIYVRLTPITDLPVDKNASLSAADLDRLTVGAAVAPLSLRPAAPRPADFDTWWAGKLAQLRKVPVNPKLNPVQSPRAEVEMSSVTLDSVGSHVRGYLAKPSKPGKYPALLIYQYAGVYALNPDTSAARAAEGWLTFNVDSHDMAPTEANAPSDYAEQGDQDRETSYFLNMYLRDTRALEYIRSRPDWDGHTVVLMGTSMGGQQSLVTAGLNPGKVTAVLVNVPSGADSQAALYGRAPAYPNWNVEKPAVARTALYFDTVNFASRITAPVVAGVGFIDTVSTPHGIFTALAQIPGSKEAVSMVESDHNHITPQKEGAYYKRSREVLDELRRTGRFSPPATPASSR